MPADVASASSAGANAGLGLAWLGGFALDFEVGAAASPGIVGAGRGPAHLLLLTSLAFLLPAFRSWRLSQRWHALLFTATAAINFTFHSCRSANAVVVLELGGGAVECPAHVLRFLANVRRVGAHYLLLQTAFLAVGPEDPQVHSRLCVAQEIGVFHGPQSRGPRREVPNDVMLATRAVPLALLVLLHVLRGHDDPYDLEWRSLLMSEVLLLAGCAFFWSRRLVEARKSLHRICFWRRLQALGASPAAVLLWLLFAACCEDWPLLLSAWHVAVAGLADGALLVAMSERNVLARLMDTSNRNPSLAHLVLGSTALLALPAAVLGVLFDCVVSGAWRWPTLGTLASLPSGGIFVSIVSLPVVMSAAVTVWLVDQMVPLQSLTPKCEWEAAGPPPHSMERQTNKRLARFHGLFGAMLGAGAALIAAVPGAWDPLGFLCSIISLGMFTAAMVLWVLSSDPTSPDYGFRKNLTMGVIVPVVFLYIVLQMLHILSWDLAVPQAMLAVLEYMLVILLSTWPLIWYTEVQDEVTRRALRQGTFSWPKTHWRFSF